MLRFGLALILSLVLSGPALAHKLRVFATVTGTEMSGYAFFVGGGRPRGVPVTIHDGTGAVVHETHTDDEGGFAWTVAAPGDYTVTVNAEDGHAASATISAARFTGGPAAAAPVATTAPAAAPSPDTAIAIAVQRGIRPLLERIEAMDNRLRLTDAISGIFLILGAAGGILWLRGRKRPG